MSNLIWFDLILVNTHHLKILSSSSSDFLGIVSSTGLLHKSTEGRCKMSGADIKMKKLQDSQNTLKTMMSHPV